MNPLLELRNLLERLNSQTLRTAELYPASIELLEKAILTRYMECVDAGLEQEASNLARQYDWYKE